MGESVITWSVPNIITILLMAVVGSIAFGAIVKVGAAAARR